MSSSPILRLVACMTTLLFIFTIVSSTVQSLPPIIQETVIVDLGGNGDYTSIREAISNADPLSIIKIRPGIYKESNIEINKRLTLIGDNLEDTIVDLEGKEGFKLTDLHIEIHNLKIINSYKYAISIPFENNYCNISNCIIENTQSHGIVVQGSYTIISNCEIQADGSTGQGVKLRGHHNLVTRCNVHGFGESILILLGATNNQILNCNIFNNNIGVDIRIDSNNNTVSANNIYGNKYGAYIWQSSYSNSIYLNNFWKNDISAFDECNNIWNNDENGNYWDDYNGIDADNNGIGDTPYVISSDNIDKYPLMSLILPDTISAPTNIECVSTSWDDTPSLSWGPSVYDAGIKGYYVTLDNNPEIFIGDTTSWTSTTPVSNGVHTFYVRALGNDDVTSSYTTFTFAIDITFIDSDSDGWSDVEEQKYGTDPDNSGNYPLDTDGDRIPDSVDTDDDNDGYNDDMELSYGTSTIDENSFPTDTDGDRIPDEDSPRYKGDTDDDGDGLTDEIETELGSNSLDGSDALKIYINGQTYYLVDTSQNQIYNILFEQTSNTVTAVEKQGENYLLDASGDGSPDHIYSVSKGTVSTYSEQLIDPFVIQIIVVIAAAIIASYVIIAYVRKRPIKTPKKIKKKIEKKQIYKPSKFYAGDKESIEMISQTKQLLQNIQQDVTIYMEKLNQIEDQIAVTSMKTQEKEIVETEITPQKTIEQKVDVLYKEDIETKADILLSDDIAAKVDYCLSKLEEKDKKGEQ